MDDKKLIQACLSNDRSAQELLYRSYAPKMYGVCLRYAGKEGGAQDILQESFIKVFRNLEKFRFQGSFEGWIRRIVVNAALDYLKKYGLKFSGIDVEDPGNETVLISEDQAVSSLAAADIMQIVEELPESKRVIFNLFAFEGYSHKEIAELLGISVMTSKSQYSKARKILREKLETVKLYSYERAH